jgi:predicted nucleic acid-binding protein
VVNPSLIGQRVYLDASALIYAIEMPQQYPGLRAKVFGPFAKGQLTLVTSWITYAEVLGRPMQIGDVTLETTYRQFFSASPVFEILRVDQGNSDEAARLRASHGFKLPDAVHVGTGIAANCTCYLTGDVKWTKAGLPVIYAGSL